MSVDPSGVKQNLELLLQRVKTAPDLDGEVRANLRNQIEAHYRWPIAA